MDALFIKLLRLEYVTFYTEGKLHDLSKHRILIVNRHLTLNRYFNAFIRFI